MRARERDRGRRCTLLRGVGFPRSRPFFLVRLLLFFFALSLSASRSLLRRTPTPTLNSRLASSHHRNRLRHPWIPRLLDSGSQERRPGPLGRLGSIARQGSFPFVFSLSHESGMLTRPLMMAMMMIRKALSSISPAASGIFARGSFPSEFRLLPPLARVGADGEESGQVRSQRGETS
jgi:hypothetical protein